MPRNTLKKRGRSKYITSLPLLLLCLPVIIYLLLFHYVPIFGMVAAFEEYNYRDNFASPFIGLRNFEFFFKSNDAAKIILNTVGYSLWFIIVSTIASVVIAVLLFEVASKLAIRFFQTTMAIPSMISWVIVSYIVYAVLSSENGIANNILVSLGMEPVSWYTSPQYWFWILTIVRIWQGVGMSCIVYYAALMALDESLFEAARLDGANRFKQIWHVSLPSILPIISVMTILAMGQIMNGNLGIFFQVPRDSAPLYAVTDVIDTYLLRNIKGSNSNIGIASAVGLFQNVCGCLMLLITNGVVKKISPENSMF